MALIAIILVSSLGLAVEAQFTNIPLGPFNPDLIFFNNDAQSYSMNVLPIASRRQQDVVDSRNDNYVQGAYKVLTPVNMIPDTRVGPAPVNVNALQRPSGDLTPPVYSPDNQLFLPQQQQALLQQTQTQAQQTQNQQQAQFQQSLPKVEERFGGDSDNKTENVVQNVPPAPVDYVSLAVSKFGIDIMKKVFYQEGNIVISPFSIGMLLALLQQGSLGVTQRQISHALQMSPNDAADGFRRLADNLEKRTSTNIFKVGNGVFLDNGFSVNPSFKQIAIKDFKSDVTQIKFSRPAQAAQKINNWIASKTNDKITQLVTPESIGTNMQMALVNAVYFKGLWAVKFRPDSTMPRDFFMYNGAKKTANFMRMRRYFRTDFDSSIGSQILSLPFEGEHYTLMIILPSETTNVMSAAAALTPEKLLSYQNYTPKEVALEIPKFTVKSDTNLISVFQQLGIINIFSPSSELTGLGNYREFAPQVSSALHSALLSIDEQGGTAAAATSFGVVALSYDDPSVIFKANRPFLAVLWDRQTSLPLFMAKIEDPVS
ncbi:leukocyte elastase inhibitor-like [Ostrinia furnacalis]|uniref:leukocyte elastase inhibitor-like n=1 Tax=Ostrinia furnacalis TaxID=93504 RepID=UPI00103CE3F8|nr:leukocyte elastase inhibitor-like [Ostrinia furnacalis]